MKKILLILMVCVLLSSNLMNVNAEDTETDTYIYSIDFLSWETEYNNGYLDAKKVNGTITSTYKMVAYRSLGIDGSSISIYIIFFNPLNSADSKEILGTMNNIRKYSTTTGTTEAGYMTKTGSFDLENYSDKYWTSSDMAGILKWDNYDYLESDNPGYLNTNIPLFNSSDEANRYIAGELTEKDAVNYETDLSGIVYDLEIPKNLHITHVSNEFEFNDMPAGASVPSLLICEWEQDDPAYVNWNTEIYCIENYKYRDDGFLFFESTDLWNHVKDFYMFGDVIPTYNLSYSGFGKEYVESLRKKESTYGDCEFETEKITFYLRNAYFDEETGLRHYSNWVKFELDYSSGLSEDSGIASVIEMEGSEFEITEDGEIIQPDADVVVDSMYTGSDYVGYEIRQSADLVGWISNGFGFLGDNGVLVLIADGFSFIPGEFWSVFIACVGVMGLVAIAKFIRG